MYYKRKGIAKATKDIQQRLKKKKRMEIMGKKFLFIAFMMALAFGFAFFQADARELLPKGATISRSPSGYYSFPRGLNFGRLPKYVPTPPSGPSRPPSGPSTGRPAEGSILPNNLVFK